MAINEILAEEDSEFLKKTFEVENNKFENLTNLILSFVLSSAEYTLNSLEKECFFFLEHYNNIARATYLHWFAGFLVTLGIFFMWCSKAIEEGSSTRITSNNLLKSTNIIVMFF